MRLIMKGGVWKNAEDEVLKAAVMKYGLNNWSRVASLLVRKTARQCKARWYEWLDPSVKKTAWSKDEDEKLLHMAKLFPTQWKTIAPLVGRTANQCLERYNQLLDVASGRDPADPNDPRKLRPGEVDPNPETRPARADAVDLDEDEREMLAEARARLANTRGKKAKRKAREKQLDEARRVAMLQKRREMKAAGMATGERTFRRKRAGVDYENEVPFESKPKPGLYPVEDQEAPVVKNEIANMKLQEVEEMRAKERVRRLRMQDRRALRRLHERDLPTAMAKVANPFSIKKRSHLTLPQPGVSDVELAALAETVERANAVSSESTGALSQMLRTAEGTRGLLPTNAGDMTTTLTAVGRKRRGTSISEFMTSALGDTSQSVFGTETGGSKRKRKRVSVADLLDRLPPTANDAAIAAGLEQLLANTAEGDGDADIDEDERDKEKRLRRKREQLLDTLAHINSRVLIFAQHLPRPLDLPTDPSLLVKMMQGSSHSSEESADNLIDLEAAKLLIHDQQFLEPEEQWKMLQNPQVFHASRTVTKAFLADCAKSFTDVSLKSLTKAADQLEAMLNTYSAQAETTPFDSVTTSLDCKDDQKIVLWDNEKNEYISMHTSDARFAELFAQNVERRVNALERLTALKRKRLHKVQQKLNILTEGYKEKAIQGLASLDKLQAYKQSIDEKEEASRWYLSIGGDSYFTSGQATKEMPMLYASDAIAAIANS